RIVATEGHVDVAAAQQRVLLFGRLEHFLKVLLGSDVGFLLLQRLARHILFRCLRNLVFLCKHDGRCRKHCYCKQGVTQCIPESVHCLILCYSRCCSQGKSHHFL